jgi:hypothetical protein
MKILKSLTAKYAKEGLKGKAAKGAKKFKCRFLNHSEGPIFDGSLPQPAGAQKQSYGLALRSLEVPPAAGT